MEARGERGLVRTPSLGPGRGRLAFSTAPSGQGFNYAHAGNTSLISRQAVKDQGNRPPVQNAIAIFIFPEVWISHFLASEEPKASEGWARELGCFQKKTLLVPAAPGLGLPRDGIKRCPWEGVAGPRGS